jgi:hypothetical protein
MSKDHLVYVVQMVIVVLEEIVVNLVIWYIYIYDHLLLKKINDLFFLLGY